VTQLTDIRTLQDLDDEVSNLSGSLEEVQRRLGGSEELNTARSAFAAADSELAGARKEQRRIDGLVQGLTAKITPEEKRLYDGSVRNPKELASIQQELELLKAQRATLEDELLEVMARLEAAEAGHAAAQKDLVRAEARWEADRARLTEESAKLGSALASAEAKRLAQQGKIPARTLAVYEDVRRRRGGVAVARVAGGNCGGCRVSIPEAVRRRAFAPDQLAQCPNCERILYVG
jgi:predicted  nucleic acid-binding Zn-ribbon protein